jgi:hypothetical protein
MMSMFGRKQAPKKGGGPVYEISDNAPKPEDLNKK